MCGNTIRQKSATWVRFGIELRSEPTCPIFELVDFLRIYVIPYGCHPANSTANHYLAFRADEHVGPGFADVLSAPVVAPKSGLPWQCQSPGWLGAAWRTLS